MRYAANTLQQMYEILENLPKPISVFDFLTGELGFEVIIAQYAGWPFYEKCCDIGRVVALCWKGSSLIYENVSDDQIELTSAQDSMRGNRQHNAGRSRVKWLKAANHVAHMINIRGIVRYSPPMHVRHAPRLYRKYGAWRSEMLGKLAEWYGKTQFVFQPPDERRIKEDYIVAFHRRDVSDLDRNTKRKHLRLFRELAHRHGLRLAVITDLRPQKLLRDVIYIKPVHRDLDLICNVIRHSFLYGGPASGMSELAALLGCNFVAFDYWPRRGDEDLLGEIVESRGFRYFGVLHKRNSQVTREIETYLCELEDNNASH